MPEKTIWLARHGETEWNTEKRYQGRDNSPLTAKGVGQAEAVAKFLQDKNIEQIYVSPLGRAQQTAEIINALLEAKIAIMPELVEMSFGSFEGQTQTATKEQNPDFYLLRQDILTKVSLPYPEGESYQDVWKRLVTPILSLLSVDQELLLIAHNSVNKVIRGILLGQDLINVIDLDQKNNQVVQILPQQREEKVHDVTN